MFRDGYTEAVSKYGSEEKIKVLMTMNENGLFDVGNAEAIFEVSQRPKAESLTDKVKSFFTSNKDNKESAENVEQENISEDGESGDDQTAQSLSTDQNTSTLSSSIPESSTTSTVESVPTSTIEKVSLKIMIERTGIPPLDDEFKMAAKSRLANLDEEDHRRRRREEIRNSLEAFAYSSRDLLSEDEILKITTDAQRIELKNLLETVSDWLYEEGDEASSEHLSEKLESLRALKDPIALRKDELKLRPTAISSFKEIFDSAKSFIHKQNSINGLNETNRDSSSNDTEATKPIPPLYTKAELDSFEKKLDEIEEWFNITMKKQESLSSHESPVVLASEILAKSDDINNELTRFKKRKRPQTEPKKANGKPEKTNKNDKERDGSDESKNNSGFDENEKNSNGFNTNHSERNTPRKKEDIKKEHDRKSHDEL